MLNLGEPVTEEEVENMMRDIDTDGDGNISYDGKLMEHVDTEGDGNINYDAKLEEHVDREGMAISVMIVC